jgi:putative transposase
VKVDNTLMPSLFTRTLKLKVRPDSYGWLSAAATEVNYVFNYCNQTSWQTATRTDLKRKAAKRCKLRWRVSRGARRSLGWVPLKAGAYYATA